jgi:hypothetical protein
MVTEDPKITRRRFLKTFGLGLAGLSTTGLLTYLFGSSRALDILNRHLLLRIPRFNRSSISTSTAWKKLPMST